MLRVRDLMTTEVTTVGPTTSLKDVARLLVERRISGVPVLERGRLVGIVSEADLLQRSPGEDMRRARDVMSRKVTSVAPDTPLEEVASILAARRIRRVPVVQSGRLVGIVSRANVVHALAVRPFEGAVRGEEPGPRIALLERLGHEAWWRGGESPERKPAPWHPMLGLRRAAERGQARHGGSQSRYSFSFGDFYDPRYTAYGPLQAINEKLVQPGHGSSTYGVRDVEILTCVLEGALRHESSLEDAVTLVAGDVHCLSAGSGARFSEANAGETPLRFLQIWLEPDRAGLPASHAHRRVDRAASGRLQPIASRDGRGGSLLLRQDALIYAGRFEGSQSACLALGSRRLGYAHLASGTLAVCGEALGAGDGFAAAEATPILLENGRGAEVLLFDVPAP